MEKFVVFLGSDFGELFNKDNWIQLSLLEKIVSKLSQITTENEKMAVLQQLENFKSKNKAYHENQSFTGLIRNIQTDLNFEKSFEENHLVVIKRIISKSFPDIPDGKNDETQSFVVEVLKNSSFIFSLHWQAYVEHLLESKGKLRVCDDRLSFLGIDQKIEEPILFKLFGTFDKVENMLVTQQQKEENSINFRLATAKAITDDKVPIVLLGFRRKEAEFNQLLKELSSKGKRNQIYLFELDESESKNLSDHYTDKATGLMIQLISEQWKHELLAVRNTKEKRTKKNHPDIADEISENKGIEHVLTAVSLRRNRRKPSRVIPVKMTAILTVSLLCVLGFNLFFSIATIKGESMAPTFQTSDYVLFNKNANKLNRFDVIAFASPDEPGQEYIKRVIGVPGDEIEYRDDQLYINGHLVEESYLKREKDKLKKVEKFTDDFSLENLTGTKKVPQNKLFVLGDNRLYSRDSRNFGFIDFKDVKGNVAVKLWPIHIGGTH